MGRMGTSCRSAGSCVSRVGCGRGRLGAARCLACASASACGRLLKRPGCRLPASVGRVRLGAAPRRSGRAPHALELSCAAVCGRRSTSLDAGLRCRGRSGPVGSGAGCSDRAPHRSLASPLSDGRPSTGLDPDRPPLAVPVRLQSAALSVPIATGRARSRVTAGTAAQIDSAAGEHGHSNTCAMARPGRIVSRGRGRRGHITAAQRAVVMAAATPASPASARLDEAVSAGARRVAAALAEPGARESRRVARRRRRLPVADQHPDRGAGRRDRRGRPTREHLVRGRHPRREVHAPGRVTLDAADLSPR